MRSAHTCQQPRRALRPALVEPVETPVAGRACRDPRSSRPALVEPVETPGRADPRWSSLSRPPVDPRDTSPGFGALARLRSSVASLAQPALTTPSPRPSGSAVRLVAGELVEQAGHGVAGRRQALGPDPDSAVAVAQAGQAAEQARPPSERLVTGGQHHDAARADPADRLAPREHRARSLADARHPQVDAEDLVGEPGQARSGSLEDDQGVAVTRRAGLRPRGHAAVDLGEPTA